MNDHDHDDTPEDVQRAYQVRDDCAGWIARADGTDGDGVSRFVASTGDVDRMGDVVEQSWRLGNWRANPVILHEHMVPVVGRGTATVDKEVGLMLAVKWDDADVNPIGQLVAHQHRSGMRSAVSVGFRPGKVIPRADLPDDDPRKVSGDVPRWQAGVLFRFNELLEVSSVAVPANAKALQVKAFAEEVEDPAEQVRRYLAEAAPRELRALIADLLQARPAALAMVRSVALGTPYSPQAPAGEATTRIPWIQPRKEAQ